VAKTLTKREAILVNEYLQDFNATRAAKAAGYGAKTAAQAGSRLLKNVKVKPEIERRTQGAMAKVEAAADAALEHLSVTSDNLIRALAEMGLAHKSLAKFLKVNGGDLEYDFTGATPEDLLAIAPMIAELKTEPATSNPPAVSWGSPGLIGGALEPRSRRCSRKKVFTFAMPRRSCAIPGPRQRWTSTNKQPTPIREPLFGLLKASAQWFNESL
jgi:hypothetical protein